MADEDKYKLECLYGEPVSPCVTRLLAVLMYVYTANCTSIALVKKYVGIVNFTCRMMQIHVRSSAFTHYTFSESYDKSDKILHFWRAL